MKNVLFIISIALLSLGCGPGINTPVPVSTSAISPTDAALRELPENDRMRKDLQKIYDKVKRTKALCAQKIGESGKDRNKLYHILTNCADATGKLRLEVRALLGWLMELQYEKAFAAIIKEIRTLIQFYADARQCVLTNATQQACDACIANLADEIRRNQQPRKEAEK